MIRQLKFFGSILLLLIVSAIIFINVRIYQLPELRVIDHQTINTDALAQLRHLRDDMEHGTDVELQNVYPEGYVFFNALYGLSWCDFASELNPNSILYQEAHVEIQRAFNNVNSEQGRIIFDEALPLPYGAFYNGWLTYLLGKKLSVESSALRNQDEVDLFIKNCDAISEVISKQTYPETYYGSAWPADVVLCVASLQLHDKLFTPRYQQNIIKWIAEVKARLDNNGLIPHAVHHKNGNPREAARGSSMSLMLCFLHDIDKEFSTSQFEIYQQLFGVNILGLSAIREYPRGISRDEDIDSGPVLFGLGGAATIVGMRTAKVHGEMTIASSLQQGIEGFALATSDDGRKKYFFNKVPIAEVFITWAQAPYKIEYTSEQLKWRTTTFMISSVLCLLFIFFFLLMWKPQLHRFFKTQRKRLFPVKVKSK